MTRTERTYYLIQALFHSSWSFTAPIYSLILLDRGLDLLQINIVFAVYLLAAFFLEVPTGAVADVYGRKISFLLSCVVRAIAFSYYYFADTFAEFLLAELIDALGTTLATGALDAWAVDGIRAEGDHRPRDRMFARAHMLARMPMILSGIAAGYIAERGFEVPFAGGAAMFLTTAAVGWWLMYDDRPSAADLHSRPRRNILAVVADGLHDVRRDGTLRLLCLLTLIIAFAALPTWHYWPPRMTALSGESVSLMGWIFAAINLSAIFGTIVVGRLESWPREWVVAFATAARGVMLMLAALATSFAPALAGFLFFEFGFAISEPILTAWTSERASPERRATVLSVRSMSFTLGGSIGLLCLGTVASGHGIPAAWMCSAIILIAAAAATMVVRLVPAAPQEVR